MGRSKLENPSTNTERENNGERKTKKTRMKLKKKRTDKENLKKAQK